MLQVAVFNDGGCVFSSFTALDTEALELLRGAQGAAFQLLGELATGAAPRAARFASAGGVLWFSRHARGHAFALSGLPPRADAAAVAAHVFEQLFDALVLQRDNYVKISLAEKPDAATLLQQQTFIRETSGFPAALSDYARVLGP